MRSESLRILCSIANSLDWEIRQVDVVSAYPRSKLHAKVYIKAPDGLDIPKGKVLLLLQALYGLKQSGREWYIEACTGLKELGFTPCYSEPSVFVNTDHSQIIGLYVDDMIILGADLRAVKETIKGIAARWQIKDLGDVSQILGLRVTRNRAEKILRIDQSPYIRATIQTFGMADANPVANLVTDRNTLVKGRQDEEATDQAHY